MKLTDLPLDLETMEALIRGMTDEQRLELAKSTRSKRAEPWVPQPGPQSDAYFSPADELLYGGAVGGGKSDLLIGLATTRHQRSLIFRSQSKDLDGFWGRLQDVLGKERIYKSNDVKRSLTTIDKRVIEGGHLGAPGSERDWMGRPHDLIGFDEAAQLAEQRVNFVMQWLRSTDPRQRKRVVFATNPPLPEIDTDGQMSETGQGDWLLRWFGPWVDDRFPGQPAEPGELRWCFMRAVGDRLETVWVEGPGCYDPETGEAQPNATAADVDNGKVAVARSRTFIRALLKDNAFYKGTGYAERLSGTPEPLKSMLLNGDFTVRGDDHPMQVIPLQWVLDAQERWEQRDEQSLLKLRQLVLYADIAQGGADTTVLASLCETDYYDELVTQPGRKTPTGKEVAAMVLEERLDGSVIALDGTGGWAGSTAAYLDERYKIKNVELHMVSKRDGSWAPDMPYRYANLRAKMWWEFRLALDPKSEHLICLPPSARLRVQLTTPRWEPRGPELYVESKDEIRKRIMGSTDEADAVLGAWQYRELALSRLSSPHETLIDKLNGRKRDQQRNADYEDYDPRGDW